MCLLAAVLQYMGSIAHAKKALIASGIGNSRGLLPLDKFTFKHSDYVEAVVDGIGETPLAVCLAAYLAAVAECCTACFEVQHSLPQLCWPSSVCTSDRSLHLRRNMSPVLQRCGHTA